MLNWNTLVYVFFNGNLYHVRDRYYCKSIFLEYKLKYIFFVESNAKVLKTNHIIMYIDNSCKTSWWLECQWTINSTTVPAIKVKQWDRLLLKGLVHKLFEGEHLVPYYIFLPVSLIVYGCIWLKLLHKMWAYCHDWVQEIWRKSRSHEI